MLKNIINRGPDIREYKIVCKNNLHHNNTIEEGKMVHRYK